MVSNNTLLSYFTGCQSTHSRVTKEVGLKVPLLLWLFYLYIFPFTSKTCVNRRKWVETDCISIGNEKYGAVCSCHHSDSLDLYWCFLPYSNTPLHPKVDGNVPILKAPEAFELKIEFINLFVIISTTTIKKLTETAIII